MMSEDLRDIQGIMTKNIQEVLGRGEKLESNGREKSRFSLQLLTSTLQFHYDALQQPSLCVEWDSDWHPTMVCAAVTTRSNQLSAGTKKFKDKATSLYRELLLRQWAPIVVVFLVVSVLLYYFWRWGAHGSLYAHHVSTPP
jgi:hypothetical protein